MPNLTNVLGLIEAKKAGNAHSPSEISDLVTAFVSGHVPDYQMAAWLMAVRLNGMNGTEISGLTGAFVDSGKSLSWESHSVPTVDKHSTGGIGDKTSLVVVPLAAACGLAVPKVSGRGLGITGGTLDKVESIPGLRVELTSAELDSQVQRIGAAIISQSAAIVPADRAVYDLRNATGTADSPGLMAASIMSKKLAVGAGTIAIDIKVGSGAFIRDHGSAREFGKLLVEIGRSANRNVRAFITDMSQPLGCAIGHSVEVSEAVAVLRGQGPPDVTDLALTIVSSLIRDSGLRTAPRAARKRTEEALFSGAAEAKFHELVAAQGGHLEKFLQHPPHEDLPVKLPIRFGTRGYVARIDAYSVGQALQTLGGARTHKDADLDRAVGIYVTKKVGNPVQADEDWGWIGARNNASAEMALATLRKGLAVCEKVAPPSSLIIDQLTS